MSNYCKKILTYVGGIFVIIFVAAFVAINFPILQSSIAMLITLITVLSLLIVCAAVILIYARKMPKQ